MRLVKVRQGPPETVRQATMRIDPTAIKEVKLIVPKRLGDDRGYFVEVFNQRDVNAAGLNFRPVQENQSLSRTPGTVRGLHFQRRSHVQAKLVRVLKGRIFDVAVDIRVGSKIFGQWGAAELTSELGEQLFIPGGFAHGFCTPEPDCEIAYLVDSHYTAECDGAILWNDPMIGIDRPDIAGTVMSDRDRIAPILADVAPPCSAPVP